MLPRRVFSRLVVEVEALVVVEAVLNCGGGNGVVGGGADVRVGGGGVESEIVALWWLVIVVGGARSNIKSTIGLSLQKYKWSSSDHHLRRVKLKLHFHHTSEVR
jgi:hypothetical protein